MKVGWVVVSTIVVTLTWILLVVWWVWAEFYQRGCYKPKPKVVKEENGEDMVLPL